MPRAHLWRAAWDAACAPPALLAPSSPSAVHPEAAPSSQPSAQLSARLLLRTLATGAANPERELPSPDNALLCRDETETDDTGARGSVELTVHDLGSLLDEVREDGSGSVEHDAGANTRAHLISVADACRPTFVGHGIPFATALFERGEEDFLADCRSFYRGNIRAILDLVNKARAHHSSAVQLQSQNAVSRLELANALATLEEEVALDAPRWFERRADGRAPPHPAHLVAGQGGNGPASLGTANART